MTTPEMQRPLCGPAAPQGAAWPARYSYRRHRGRPSGPRALAALMAVLILTGCATGAPGEAEARLAALCKAHEIVVQQLTPYKARMSASQVETVEASFEVRDLWCTGQAGDAVAGLAEMAGSMGPLTQVQADLAS